MDVQAGESLFRCNQKFHVLLLFGVLLLQHGARLRGTRPQGNVEGVDMYNACYGGQALGGPSCHGSDFG